MTRSGTEPNPAQRLIFALDVPTRADAASLVAKLEAEMSFFKIGLELFSGGDGAPLCRELVAAGKKVFVDIKLFDVPATVARATARVAELGATFLTVHGNDAILEAAVREAGDTGILSVTSLTSLDRSDLESLGFSCDPAELALSRASRALDIGCRGVVSSGLEVAQLRKRFGEHLAVVTPGVRPVLNVEDEDQKRISTPEQAVRDGADYIVVGRPIRDAADPAESARQIIKGIGRGLAARNSAASGN